MNPDPNLNPNPNRNDPNKIIGYNVQIGCSTGLGQAIPLLTLHLSARYFLALQYQNNGGIACPAFLLARKSN